MKVMSHSGTPDTELRRFFDMRNLGKAQGQSRKYLTLGRNRPTTADPAIRARQLQIDHDCHFVEETLSHRPLPYRARSVRQQTNQEGRQDRPLFWYDIG